MTEEYDEELEAIKLRKLQEYQRRLQELEERERAQREFEAQKEAMLRAILTPEARQRLINLKLVRPQLAESLELQLIQLAQAGRLKIPVTDKELKMILAELYRRTRRDIKIKFYRR
ncbi:MAG: DNA-binding protein [Thermoprotei archaeon]|nr:MAG: DNA-binding protein [Thermoprotei archaeon]RLF00814.1 MAG: DNA-binding protein [Thermoprotei archaeon]HDI74520.1 DNA-binding protein [Thermoprotei archaeon]